MHRDIKPENILLHEGAAMVADFGIGKALSGGQSVTQTGHGGRHAGVHEPGAGRGEAEIDGRSDLYSLGCVLYEMLTGEPPFTGPTAQAIISKRFVSPIPKVRATRDVPEAVDAAVTRALARTPVDRFRTGAEFAEALQAHPARRRLRSDAAHAAGDQGRDRHQAIAVLPLANMSADPENEYFSDGMTEEIINALAKVPGMQVASRTSSFAFKGRRTSTSGRSARNSASRRFSKEASARSGTGIRITAQLVNVENGYQLWSETYDRQLEDVFAVQDEISRSIVDALKLRLVGSESRRSSRRRRTSRRTRLYLKGRFYFNKFTEPGLRKALDLFESALLPGSRIRPGVRGDRGRVVQSRRRLGCAERRVSPREGGGRAGAASGIPTSPRR